jgi:hypothetical protein
VADHTQADKIALQRDLADGTFLRYRVGATAGDIEDPRDGDLWYNSSTGKFRKRQGGATTDLDTVGGGGSTPTGTGFRHVVDGVEGTAAKLVDTADVNPAQITYAKIQNISATDRVLGRSSAGAGVAEEIACTAAGRALIDDADAAAQRTTLGLGALATLATVGTAQIDNSAVTYAKIQNVAATDRLLGRSTAGAGVVEEVVCTAAGRALIDDASASAQRTTLGLGAWATFTPTVDPEDGALVYYKGGNLHLLQAPSVASRLKWESDALTWEAIE